MSNSYDGQLHNPMRTFLFAIRSLPFIDASSLYQDWKTIPKEESGRP